MERKRISEEVIEILCHKLPQLPLPSEEPGFDFDGQILVPHVTANDLDIAEVTMDLEDAFGIVFDLQIGEAPIETIGQVTDYIKDQLDSRFAK